jgi:hypothetical protein
MTTVEYEIPAGEPWGACHTEVLQVLTKTREEYFTQYGHWPSDDAIRVHVTDEALLIVFEKKG